MRTDVLHKSVRVLAHLKEVRLFASGLDLSSAVGAASVHKLALRPETFARGAVHSLVFALVNVALVEKLFEYVLNGALVIVVRGADKLIVLHVRHFPQLLYLRGHAVYKLLGTYSLFLGFELYLLPVLVSAGHKKDVLALKARKARYCVGKDNFVGVADVGLARSIGYSRSDVKLFCHSSPYFPRVRGIEYTRARH